MPVQPPFRAEHVGSLLRPAALKRSFQQYREGRLGAADYEAALTDAIRGAVRTQEHAGLQSITDGEFGRNSWFGFFFERMDGFRLEPSAFEFRDGEGGSYEWPTCYACARMQRHGPIAVDEHRRLASLTRRTPKMTLPSPSAFHFFRFNSPTQTTTGTIWSRSTAQKSRRCAMRAAAICNWTKCRSQCCAIR